MSRTLETVNKKVAVFHQSREIGSGELVASDRTPTGRGALAVNFHYTWPPDAPAEIPAFFKMELQTAELAFVDLSWPGLLPAPIGGEATYQLEIEGFFNIYLFQLPGGIFIRLTDGRLLPTGVEGISLEVAVPSHPPVTLVFPFLPVSPD